MAEKFLTDHMTTLKPKAAKRYGVSIKCLAAHFGAMTLDQISSATLSEFESKRRLDGVTSGTIRRDFACLSSMLTSANDWEWIKDGQNPVPSYLKRRAKRGLKEAPARTRYLTEAEEARLIANATECRDAIILSIDTGLRLDELFGLTWPQVDIAGSTIDTGKRTKSGRSRRVPVPARSRTILGTLKTLREGRLGRSNVVPLMSRRKAQMPPAAAQESPDYVLVNPATGTRYVTMQHGIKAAAKRAKLKDVRWHDLRRTAGCRWLQVQRRSMEEVCILLGHSSVTVTEKSYAFLQEQEVAESVAAHLPAQGQRIHEGKDE
jgi:integrase